MSNYISKYILIGCVQRTTCALFERGPRTESYRRSPKFRGQKYNFRFNHLVLVLISLCIWGCIRKPDLHASNKWWKPAFRLQTIRFETRYCVRGELDFKGKWLKTWNLNSHYIFYVSLSRFTLGKLLCVISIISK